MINIKKVYKEIFKKKYSDVDFLISWREVQKLKSSCMYYQGQMKYSIDYANIL